MSELYGGVETGGTWCVCAIGRGPDEIVAHERFATGAPEQTLARIAGFFEDGPAIVHLGIGSFGPVDLDPASPTWGHVTSTPKPGWASTAIAGPLRDRLGVPIAFENDVNAAALGERRWGAGRDAPSLCYVTIGTGIGAGLLIDDRPVHGLVHPEVGHLRVPHDRDRDPFAGSCPFHGDCWEGLASGPALRERWGAEPHELADDHPAWELEAEYVALGVLAIVMVASPHRVILGGGVMERGPMFALVRERLRTLVAGYLVHPRLGPEVADYLVGPELGDDAGVLGAIALARDAHARR